MSDLLWQSWIDLKGHEKAWFLVYNPETKKVEFDCLRLVDGPTTPEAIFLGPLPDPPGQPG